MSLTKQVTQKLDEYGIEIFKDYEVEEKGEHVFYSRHMIVFVNDSDNSISVTFQATTKPEKSASLALILNQLRDAEMHIMEPFIFNDKNEFISGEAAYQLIENADKEKIRREMMKHDIYSHILETSECHEC
jgi:hypothetical protein